MFKFMSRIIITTLVFGLSAIEVNADDDDSSSGGYVDDCSSGGCGNEVPELSAAVAPLALASILGIAGVGLERRRRKSKK